MCAHTFGRSRPFRPPVARALASALLTLSLARASRADEPHARAADSAHSNQPRDRAYFMGGGVGLGPIAEARAFPALSWQLLAMVELDPAARVGLALRRVHGLGDGDGYPETLDTYGLTARGEFHFVQDHWVEPYAYGELGYGFFRFTTDSSGESSPTYGLVSGAGLGVLFRTQKKRGPELGVGPQLSAYLGPENLALLAELRMDFKL